MSKNRDGPRSPHFTPLTLKGNATLPDLAGINLSERMAAAREQAPRGSGCVLGDSVRNRRSDSAPGSAGFRPLSPTTAALAGFPARFDERPPETNPHGFISPIRGRGQLAEHAADYVISTPMAVRRAGGHPPPPPDRRLRAALGRELLRGRSAAQGFSPARRSWAAYPRTGAIGAARQHTRHLGRFRRLG